MVLSKALPAMIGLKKNAERERKAACCPFGEQGTCLVKLASRQQQFKSVAEKQHMPSRGLLIQKTISNLVLLVAKSSQR